MLVQLDTPPVVPKLARATIFLAFFGNGFLATCWVVHIPRIRSLLGLSDGELGLILWAATFGLFLGTTLGGWIVERYRSQFVTGIALICLGVATMLAVVSANRLALVLSLVPFGFCNGLIDVSMNSQAAAFEQRTKRWATGSLRCRHRSRRGGIGACLPGGNYLVSVAGFGLVGVGLANCVPLIFSAAARQSDAGLGRAIAAVASAGYFGFFAGPPLIGSIAELIGLQKALLLVGVALILTLLLTRVGLGATHSPRSE
jgi:MFS family permease